MKLLRYQLANLLARGTMLPCYGDYNPWSGGLQSWNRTENRKLRLSVLHIVCFQELSIENKTNNACDYFRNREGEPKPVESKS